MCRVHARDHVCEACIRKHVQAACAGCLRKVHVHKTCTGCLRVIHALCACAGVTCAATPHWVLEHHTCAGCMRRKHSQRECATCMRSKLAQDIRAGYNNLISQSPSSTPMSLHCSSTFPRCAGCAAIHTHQHQQPPDTNTPQLPHSYTALPPPILLRPPASLLPPLSPVCRMCCFLPPPTSAACT